MTKLIVNVYQMIKLYSLVTQQIHCPYQPKQSPSILVTLCICFCAVYMEVHCGHSAITINLSEDRKDGDEDDQVDVWCFPERKTVQH